MTPVLRVIVADITTLDVDAIVNAANEQLIPGSGVCGAIHRAAGPELAAACELVAPCPTGEARVTPGFDLPARFVIHAVGPRWMGGGQHESVLLARAYQAAFSLARAHGIRTIAFPAISTGIYGYPLGPATEIAVSVTRVAAPAAGVKEVLFACFTEAAVAAYRAEGITG